MPFRDVKNPVKLKVKTGDTVIVITGKDKGQRGRIIAVEPKKQIVMVESLSRDKDGHSIPLNAVTKHRKARQVGEQGSKVKQPSPLHISKIMLIDPSSDKPTRVGRRLETPKGAKKPVIVRYAKGSGKTIVDERS